ncbi:MAG TPA: zf-HC2 domain-containing protein [Pyrinomonadaceae bacterium]|jgi:hypothetical protein|nr:zf-HC2 domain-containing protein [Pyrinomonadaceae bacterium]
MEEKELTRLLRSNIDATKRGWRCPDDNQLAAYVNRQVADPRRQKLEAHFANCKACLETLAFVAQAFDESPVQSVPAHLLARARSLADDKRPVVWRWAFAAATACALIIAALIVWNSRANRNAVPPEDLVAQQKQPERAPEPLPVGVTPTRPENNLQAPKPKPTESRAPVVRGQEDRSTPTLIFPRNGSVIRLAQQSIRWKAVANVSFYDIKVVTEDGSPVVNESTNNTEIQLNTAGLQVGGKYFVTVVAHLSGDRTARSEMVSFRVGGP